MKNETRHLRPVVVAALARGATHTEAATAAGTSRATIDRILAADPTIRDEIEERRYALLAETARKIDEAAPKAVDVLVELLEQDDLEAPHRIRAALGVLGAQGDRLPAAVLIDRLHKADARISELQAENAALRREERSA